jgi:four helix bundle protein
MEGLRRLDVWKRACRLSVNVYGLTRRCPDRAYRDQVTRSALSIASNIAEGYERGTNRDRARFLQIAKGSCGECWTQLLIGAEASFFGKKDAGPLITETEELAKMLRGLIRYFEAQDG